MTGFYEEFEKNATTGCAFCVNLLFLRFQWRRLSQIRLQNGKNTAILPRK
jgi:hypothetical protein